MKIESVIFDYGDVISQPQRKDCIEKMVSICGVERAQFDKGYWQFRLDYDRKMDNFTYFRNAGQVMGVSLTNEQIEELTLLDNQSWTQPNPTMLSWIAMLESSGVGTALLSNMPLVMSEYILSNCDWFPRFETAVFSSKVGYVKPEKEIFMHCLEAAGMEAKSTLFIDDRIANIEGAKATGMIGLHFTGVTDAFAIIKERFDLPYPLPS